MLKESVTYELEHDTLFSSDIFKFWAYVHNLATIALKKLDIIDRFGRMRMDRDTALELIKETGHNEDPYKAMPVVTGIMNEQIELWVNVFPKEIWQLPQNAIIDKLMTSREDTRFEFLNSQNVVCAFPVGKICNDWNSAVIYYKPAHRQYVLELRMINMYGNECTLAFESNTAKMLDFMAEIEDLDKLTVILQPQNGSKCADNKILCSMILKGEDSE